MNKLNKTKAVLVSILALSMFANIGFYACGQAQAREIQKAKASTEIKDNQIKTLENQMLIANEEINNLRTQIELKEFEQPKNSDSE